MKYLIIDDDEIKDDIEDVLNYCIEDDYHEDDDYFEEWVNDRYSSVEINGVDYYPYEIISNANDGNYRDLVNDFCEAMNDDDWSNAEYELEHAGVGNKVHIQRYTVEVIEDEDYDGDEHFDTVCAEEMSKIDNVRERINNEKKLKIEQTIESEKEEKDLMKMFQIVGE